MDILDSALSREIDRIKSNNLTETSYYWYAEIHAGGKTIEALKLLSMDIIRDYESNFTDEVIVTLSLGAGKYATKIYPNLSKLEITLYRKPLGEVGGGEDSARPITSERFVATLLDPLAINVAGNSTNEIDETALDLTNILTLSFQLVNKAVDQMRMKTIGGVYRATTVEDVVKSILTMHSAQIEVDSTDMPQGVEMISSSNEHIQDHVVIPHGTRLVDAPNYIHKNCSGIYTAGLAYYYQARIWYVFPPYDNGKFEKSQKTLTIIRLPENRMPGVERTYRKDGNNLVILATGRAAVKNDSEAMLLTAGNGVRFSDANQFMETVVEKRDNKAVMSRGGVNNEFTTVERPSGNNLVLTSNARITSNPWLEYSKLAPRNGSLLAVTWENSNPELILPGMPVKLLYLEGEEIKETFGLVVKAHHYTQTRGVGVTASRHRTTSSLTIFAKRELK